MLTLAIALFTVAPIEDWKVIETAANGVIYSLNLDSVRDLGTYREAWTKTDYSNVPTGDVSIRRTWEDFDCAGRRMRLRGTITYGRDGKVMRTLNLDEGKAEWKGVTPATMGEAKFDAVCSATIRS